MAASALQGGERHAPFLFLFCIPFTGDYARADYPCPGTAVHHIYKTETDPTGFVNVLLLFVQQGYMYILAISIGEIFV